MRIVRFFLCLLAAVILFFLAPVLHGGTGTEDSTPPEARSAVPEMEPAAPDLTTVARVSGNRIAFYIGEGDISGVPCYVTRVWTADPAGQITKRTSPWQQGLTNTGDLCAGIPGALLAVNASGYVSPVYSWIPESYPGKKSDYFYTPLGSLTVTNGEVMRNLDGVPYFGLTLEGDGLHLYSGENNADILSRGVIETWSFYEQCPLIMEGKSILPSDWSFARASAARNILCLLEDGTCLILTVPGSPGLTLFECVDFLLAEVKPLWAFNLDGGPSAALYYRLSPEADWIPLVKNRQKNVDILAFTE